MVVFSSLKNVPVRCFSHRTSKVIVHAEDSVTERICERFVRPQYVNGSFLNAIRTVCASTVITVRYPNGGICPTVAKL